MRVWGSRKGHSEWATSLLALVVWHTWDSRRDIPPRGARGVLPAMEACFKGELMFMLALSIGALGVAAGDERKKRGEEDVTF